MLQPGLAGRPDRPGTGDRLLAGLTGREEDEQYAVEPAPTSGCCCCASRPATGGCCGSGSARIAPSGRSPPSSTSPRPRSPGLLTRIVGELRTQLKSAAAPMYQCPLCPRSERVISMRPCGTTGPAFRHHGEEVAHRRPTASPTTRVTGCASTPGRSWPPSRTSCPTWPSAFDRLCRAAAEELALDQVSVTVMAPGGSSVLVASSAEHGPGDRRAAVRPRRGARPGRVRRRAAGPGPRPARRARAGGRGSPRPRSSGGSSASSPSPSSSGRCGSACSPARRRAPAPGPAGADRLPDLRRGRHRAAARQLADR